MIKKIYLKKKDFLIYYFLFKNDPSVFYLKKLLKIINAFQININIIYNHISLLHIKQKKDTMKLLLENGGNPNLENIYGITPIMLQYDYETIRLLYDNGVDIYKYDDYYYFNILFWQKDEKSMEFLLKKDVNLYFNYPLYTRNKISNHIYMKLFIDGGYDPYNQSLLSLSPFFIQRNIKTQSILLNNLKDITLLFDIYHETPIYKYCTTISELKLYINHKNYNINHKNAFGNTLLHTHFDLDIILYLLQNNADLTIRNILNFTHYIFHLQKNNINVCNLMKDYYSSTLIQRNWSQFIFQKKYVPIKNFKLKQKLLQDITLLPPSHCHIFPGGIIYQNSLDDFHSISSISSSLTSTPD